LRRIVEAVGIGKLLRSRLAAAEAQKSDVVGRDIRSSTTGSLRSHRLAVAVAGSPGIVSKHCAVRKLGMACRTSAWFGWSISAIFRCRSDLRCLMAGDEAQHEGMDHSSSVKNPRRRPAAIHSLIMSSPGLARRIANQLRARYSS